MPPRAAPDRLLYRILSAGRGIAALAVITCSLLATVDTIGLWLFHRPVASVVELSQMLLVVIVFMGLGAAERDGDHIAVAIVRDRLPPGGRRLADLVVQAVSTLVYLAIAAAGFAAAMRSFEVQEFSDGLLPFPIYPIRFLLVFGALLSAAAAIAVAIWRRRSDSDPDIGGV